MFRKLLVCAFTLIISTSAKADLLKDAQDAQSAASTYRNYAISALNAAAAARDQAQKDFATWGVAGGDLYSYTAYKDDCAVQLTSGYNKAQSCKNNLDYVNDTLWVNYEYYKGIDDKYNMTAVLYEIITWSNDGYSYAGTAYNIAGYALADAQTMQYYVDKQK